MDSVQDPRGALPDVPPRPLESFGRYLQRIGFKPAQIDYVRRAFANAAGESLRHLDAASMLDSIAGAGDTGHEDFRIVEGYGAVLEALGVGAEIRTQALFRDRWIGVAWRHEPHRPPGLAGPIRRGLDDQ